ncbi:hypothetical protein CS062_16335 [Roseateles chitinivorans]|uniref:Uncharacterized protein n=1 Tax=Roseateles chitinivorans TaxID=2917965 RepID=A0A2G9C6P4_9BURK|nr:hypothetical protein [Roseateles chitinivorans]PIM52120.1 hypothetical protein CS062_16335 [Roseateles chitinivorans]
METEGNLKLRHLQSEIDRALDRSRLLHNKEFEVLGGAWSRLYDAYWWARRATSLLQLRPSFQGMSAAHAEAFIGDLELPTWAKDELRALDDYRERNTRLREFSERFDYNKGNNLRLRCVRYVEKRSVYIRPEIRTDILALLRIVGEALIELQLRIDHEPVHPIERTRSERLEAEETGLLTKIQAAIQDRIWDASVAPAADKS